MSRSPFVRQQRVSRRIQNLLCECATVLRWVYSKCEILATSISRKMNALRCGNMKQMTSSLSSLVL